MAQKYDLTDIGNIIESLFLAQQSGVKWKKAFWI